MVSKSPRLVITQELLQRAPKGFILDVGCGDNPQEFHFVRYIGLDKNAELLAKISKEGIANKDLICANGNKLPFRDGSFCTIICTEVLEHLDAPENAISEFTRVLKKGGVGVISVPSLSLPQTITLWIAQRTNKISDTPYQSSEHKREYSKFNVSHHFNKTKFLFDMFDQKGLAIREVYAVQPLLTRPKTLYQVLRKIEPLVNKIFSTIQIGHYIIFEVEKT